MRPDRTAAASGIRSRLLDCEMAATPRPGVTPRELRIAMCARLAGLFQPVPRGTDNRTSHRPHGNDSVAFTKRSPVLIDRTTLATRGVVKYDDELNGLA